MDVIVLLLDTIEGGGGISMSLSLYILYKLYPYIHFGESRIFVVGCPKYALTFGRAKKTTSAMARWHWLDGRPCLYRNITRSFRVLRFGGEV